MKRLTATFKTKIEQRRKNLRYVATAEGLVRVNGKYRENLVPIVVANLERLNFIRAWGVEATAPVGSRLILGGLELHSPCVQMYHPL